MYKISVIIPMYNTEDYIGQCLQSVINQTYRNLEIIVIDDGSTDGGPEVCRRLSQTDHRIQLYHQENRGASRARNYGLDIAAGEYIFFLDSDDAIHPLLLEEMIGQAEIQGAQMVFCDCARLESLAFGLAVREASEEDGRPAWQMAEGYAAEEWFHIKYGRELSGIWGLFRREYIGELRFDENLIYGEDTLFKYRLFCRQGRTLYSPVKWYYYRMHSESLMHVYGSMENRHLAHEIIIRDEEYKKGRYEFARKRGCSIIFQLEDLYTECRKRKDWAGCKRIKEAAWAERLNPLFWSFTYSIRFRYVCFFLCYPVYILLDKMIVKVWEWKNSRER